jgi:pyrroloquinoline quinone (PQQ) biosynthesis protein C
MQETAIQNSIQPFAKLAQQNMAAFASFATSAEVFTPGTSALSDSNAYARLMQTLLKNYTDFLTEVSQSALQIMSEGQAALVRHTEEATESVAEATTTRGRRAR